MSAVVDESVEDRIRANFPRIREWWLQRAAEVAVRNFLDAETRAVEDSTTTSTVGRRVVQTPGPGQT